MIVCLKGFGGVERIWGFWDFGLGFGWGGWFCFFLEVLEVLSGVGVMGFMGGVCDCV